MERNNEYTRIELADLIIKAVISWEPNLDSKTWALLDEYKRKYLNGPNESAPSATRSTD